MGFMGAHPAPAILEPRLWTAQLYCSRSASVGSNAHRAKRAPHSPAATPEEAPHWLPQLLWIKRSNAIEHVRNDSPENHKSNQSTVKPIAAKTSPRRTTNPKTSPAARPTPLATDFKRTDAPPFPKARRTNPPLQEAARKPRSTSAARFKAGEDRRLHDKFVERGDRKNGQISIESRNRSAHRVQVRPGLTGNPQEYH